MSGELVIPVNREIQLLMHAKDVGHSFYVRELRIQQDFVPGLDLAVHFTATKVGKYEIVCTQLCGLGHYNMKAYLNVMSPEPDFDKWLKDQEARSSNSAQDAVRIAVARELGQLSTCEVLQMQETFSPTGSCTCSPGRVYPEACFQSGSQGHRETVLRLALVAVFIGMGLLLVDAHPHGLAQCQDSWPGVALESRRAGRRDDPGILSCRC